MKKFFNTNWFTLVELMISIAIIGILAAVLFPSVTGYFERARDTAKKQNIKQLILGINMFYADMGTYKIPNLGYEQMGTWFINYIEPTRGLMKPYITTMDKELRDLWYSTLHLKTLYRKDLIPTTSTGGAMNRTECFTYPVHKDMYNFHFDENESGYVFTAFLERPTQKEKNHIKTVYYAMGEDGTCSRWWMNYAVDG